MGLRVRGSLLNACAFQTGRKSLGLLPHSLSRLQKNTQAGWHAGSAVMSWLSEGGSTLSCPPHWHRGHISLAWVAQAAEDECSVKLLSSIWTKNGPLDLKPGSLPFKAVIKNQSQAGSFPPSQGLGGGGLFSHSDPVLANSSRIQEAVEVTELGAGSEGMGTGHSRWFSDI